MWASWAESTKASLTHALEKTGDVITKAASQAGKISKTTSPETPDGQSSTSGDTEENAKANELGEKKKEFLVNLQAGWSTVVETTKASLSKAQEALEDQQIRLQERINEARHTFYKRDPTLPLDVVALRDAQVVYITDRLITMSHPAMASSTDALITGERKLAAIGHLLERRHNGRFMVWNISEVEYETRILDEQVLTFSFPGSPSPPLGLLMKLLISMEAWLKADDRNVAVVHCLTGKGRTSTVLASFLCWMGQAGFGDIYQAMEYIAACKQLPPEELTIPSQRRYASYFKNMLDGVRPSQPPLMLKRIIMSEAPRYAKGPPRDDDKAQTKEDRLMGCAPYLQVFKAGKLLYTTPASLHFQQSEDELPFVQVADGAISFNVNIIVQGDILVRCRHLTNNKKSRISMFRAAFHTGYIPPKVLRLKKSELDGACNDERFPDDFFLDLIFEPVDAEEASKLLAEQEGRMSEEDLDEEDAVASTGKSKEAQVLAGGATHVTASTYDSMLHRDSRFWDVIAARRQEQAQKQPDKDNQQGQTDPLWGPTIGRRRIFNESKDKKDSKTSPSPSKEQRTALETFSIGGELDFLPGAEEPAKPAEPPQRKKDSLMEALMGALNDEDHHANDLEVVIFDHAHVEDSTQVAEKTTDSGVVASPAAEVVEPPIVASSSGYVSTDASRGAVSEKSQSAASSDVDDVEALLADANLNLDGDVAALLAEANGGNAADDLDIDDVDDAELEDLENFLSKNS